MRCKRCGKEIDRLEGANSYMLWIHTKTRTILCNSTEPPVMFATPLTRQDIFKSIKNWELTNG